MRPAPERIGVIDLWRGFALFGVAVVNFVHANDDYLTPAAAEALATAGLDWRLERLMNLLLANKSNTLFTFLFGLGFAILMERGAEGANGEQVLRRRMVVLTLLGLTQLFLLYHGELLHMYGLCGLLLLVLRRFPDRVLFVLGILLALFARLFYEEWSFVGALAPLPDISWTTPDSGLTPAADYRLLHESSALQLVQANAAHAMSAMYDFPRKLVQGAYFFGRMLIGFTFWRSGWCMRVIAAPRERILRWVSIAGIAAVVLTAATFMESGRVGTLQHFLFNLLRQGQTLALSAFYVLALVAIGTSPSLQRFARPFQQLGRMSLTNYLLQSVAMMLLLYGPGLRLAGDIGATATAAIAAAVYVAQVVFSNLWLRHRSMGPAEKFWRWLASSPKTERVSPRFYG
jgi:uncharacterized protein